MSVGRSKGGLPPDALVEDEAAILADAERLIDRWHDPARHSMLRIVVAPCSPFSVSRELMRDAAALEFDLDTGKRGERDSHLRELLCELTGAEDATIEMGECGIGYPTAADIGMQHLDATGGKFIGQQHAAVIHSGGNLGGLGTRSGGNVHHAFGLHAVGK